MGKIGKNCEKSTNKSEGIVMQWGIIAEKQ